jgi:hypothetical protein
VTHVQRINTQGGRRERALQPGGHLSQRAVFGRLRVLARGIDHDPVLRAATAAGVLNAPFLL